MRRLYLIIFIFAMTTPLSAQVTTPLPHSEGQGVGLLGLLSALHTIERSQSEYRIDIVSDGLEGLTTTANVSGLDAVKAVKRVCKGLPVKVKVHGKRIYVQHKQTGTQRKKVTISGDVVDGFLKVPLPSAKVSICRADSSVVVDSANMVRFFNREERLIKAHFGAEIIAAEREYLVHAQLDGYDDVWQRVTISKYQDDVEVPTLQMRKMRTVNLRGVTITATKVKFFWRGDTLIYDATAFRLPEGSMLDDLIRQLPGVTMNDQGEIFVNGRKVDELLLGSRSFFGGNKKVLMENLPYYTVKNLKVYEKRTDKSAALGYDVEPRRYVMDVNLKNEYSQGYIGNVEVAVGTKRRWLGRGFLLGFTDRLRITLLANANNVNEGRHIGRSDQWSPARQPRSLLTTRSVAGEIDYQAQDESVKETFRTDYTSTTDEQTMSQHRERFLEGYTPTSLTESFNRKGTKKLNLHNSLTLRKPFWISTEAEFNYAKRDGSFNSAFDEWGDSLTISQRTVGMSEGKAWGGYFETQGAFNLGKKLHLDFYAKVEHTSDESEQASRYTTSGKTSDLQHNSNNLFNHTTWGTAHVGSAKEVAEDFYINITDFFDIRKQHNRDYLYHPDTLLLPSQIEALTALTDPRNSYDSRDFDWTNNLIVMLVKKLYYTHPDFHIKVDYARWQLYLRLPVQYERLHYQRGVLDTLARQTVFVPNFNFNYRNVWKGGRRDFQFHTEFNQERTLLMDRINIYDDSQPLVVKLGNPDLKPSAVTKVSADYYDHAGRNKAMYHLSASFNYHHRDVAQSLTYNPATGVYTYKPMNISGACGAFVMFSTDQNICEKRYCTWHINVAPLWDHAKDHVMLAGQTESHVNTVNTFALSSGTNIRFNRKTFSVRAVGYINWRHSEGAVCSTASSSGESLNALDFHYGLESYYTLPRLNTSLAADGTMYSRRGYGSSELNTDDFIVNASVSQPLLKGKLIARLEAFDLLHQLSNTDYAINAQGRTVTWYRSLPHYVMLHLVYHFNKNPQKNK